MHARLNVRERPSVVRSRPIRQNSRTNVPTIRKLVCGNLGTPRDTQASRGARADGREREKERERARGFLSRASTRRCRSDSACSPTLLFPPKTSRFKKGGGGAARGPLNASDRFGRGSRDSGGRWRSPSLPPAVAVAGKYPSTDLSNFK